MNTILAYTHSCMPAPKHLGFPPGKTLPEELSSAMKRIETSGIIYPDGYYQTLLEKYTRDGVCYPHILMILGEPRINNHFYYPHVVRGKGKLLDYGCGTGDNVRQLIRDGFPRERIIAFDINRASIDLGFDLYLDRDRIGDLFTVSEIFPYGPDQFDLVYSASVFHVIVEEDILEEYLSHAWSTLKPGGILFGSTAGLKGEEIINSPNEWGPPRILTEDQLTGFLTCAGFEVLEIVERPHGHHHVPQHKNRCVLEFCAKKPE
ncbi:class I SAM-dependent methyltransferase [Methanoregula sp.]|uniref:class I SAM-dependent methyltransferase n=1 Tax=Methanoregula sp. TaxID=2052170 RepID=UPI003BB0D18B